MSAPSRSELISVFGRIGVLSFGGPAAQIALMQRELVEERAWLSEAQFLRALSFCMLLPGPEAMQLATYAGWRLQGVIGGLIAGLLFVLPGAAVILALALIYAWLGDVPLVQALFLGVKAAVVVIVIEALLKISKRALKSRLAWILAGASFVAIYAFGTPFPAIILCAAAIGALFLKPAASEAPAPLPAHKSVLRTIVTWLAIWLVPLAAMWLFDPEFLAPLASFFAKLAVVTFGGAYAVLAYMTQTVVQDFNWLSTPEMMDALGLAETTPGPLILVTEFVGILAGYREAGLGLATLAGIVTLWMTFAPCFLWIFAGAPYIDWLSGRPALAGALAGITAAVVGVILNLSIWFAIHVFFTEQTILRLTPSTFGQGGMTWPIFASANLTAIAIALVAGYLLLRRHVDLLIVLAISAGLSLIASYVT